MNRSHKILLTLFFIFPTATKWKHLLRTVECSCSLHITNPTCQPCFHVKMRYLSCLTASAGHLHTTDCRCGHKSIHLGVGGYWGDLWGRDSVVTKACDLLQRFIVAVICLSYNNEVLHGFNLWTSLLRDAAHRFGEMPCYATLSFHQTIYSGAMSVSISCVSVI